MKKKVAIAGTAGLPANYGGFETLAENLVKHLNGHYDFVVYCKKTPRAQRRQSFSGARLIYLPFHSNGWQSPLYDLVSLFHAFITVDVILYLGPVVGYFLPINRLFEKNLLVNFGGLNEWEREKISKVERKYMLMSCFVAAHYATTNIADNTVLQRSIRKVLKRDSVVVRYGGDHTGVPKEASEVVTCYPFASECYFVSVARAQIDNNLHVMIEAFRAMPQKKLVIVSNWCVSQYGRDLFEQNQNIDNIILLPAMYDLRHLDYIRSRAVAYIHSHSYCGTAPSLVEAICLGLPIISWDVPTNRETTHGHALFFDSVESLRSVIENISQAALDEVRDALRPLAEEEYKWSRVCKEYAALFDGNVSKRSYKESGYDSEVAAD